MTASLLDLRFLGLLGLVCMSRAIWPSRHYALLGALASAGLVLLASIETFLAIAGVTLFYIFPVHRMMHAFGTQNAKRARILFFASVAGLVAFLFTYKLYQNLDFTLFGASRLDSRVFALVGFSYFLFRAISFLHIQSILPIDERTPWGLLYFFFFPPTLTSGPIQKYQDFRQQLTAPTPLAKAALWTATYRITRGYFRKLFLAASLDSGIQWLLAAPVSSAYVSIAVIALLYLYFYFDFAGYSDIAIGFGLILGIQVPENFRRPFLATSLTEFWRNWHITLVDWFRDQVFIPMGGMTAGRLRSGTLALLIMVLCGLWHGLTYSFLLWGLWHGGNLFAEAVLGSKPVPPSRRHGWNYWLRVGWTNARVAAASVLFLPNTNAILSVFQGFGKWY